MKKLFNFLVLMLAIASINAQSLLQQQLPKSLAPKSSTALFSEDFSTATGTALPDGWTQAAGADATETQWTVSTGVGGPPNASPTQNSGRKFAVFMTVGTAKDNDNWMISSDISLEAGQAYSISFYAYMPAYPNADDFQKLEVRMGQGATIAAMEAGAEIYQNVDESIGAWTLITKSFTPTVDGTYNLGFRVFTPAGKGFALGIDYINVEEKQAAFEPFFEGFETTTGSALPEGWTQVAGTDADDTKVWTTRESVGGGPPGTGTTPKSGSRLAAFQTWGTTANNDNWMISPNILLVAGETYQISFHVFMPVFSGNQHLEVRLGQGTTIVAMEAGTQLYHNIDESISEWKLVTYDYTSATGGNYNLGFRVFTPAGAGFFLCIDDIEVVEKPEVVEGYDVGVTAIIDPNSGELTADETVKVTVKNFGTLTITELPVVLMVDGEVVAEETIEEEILPNETFDYTFDEKVNLSKAGKNYVIKVFTKLENDINPTNDTLTKEVTNTAPIEEFDAGVTAVADPRSGMLTETEAVKVTVRNFGTLTITELPIVLMVDGEVVAEETIEEEILPNATFNYTFTEKIDLSEAGRIYTIRIFTDINGDINRANDTITREVQNTTRITDALFWEGFENPTTSSFDVPVGWTLAKGSNANPTERDWFINVGGMGGPPFPGVSPSGRESSSRFAAFMSAVTEDDGWMISPNIPLEEGQTYTINFFLFMSAAFPADGDYQRLKAHIGQGTTIAAMEAGTEIYRKVDGSTDGWVLITQDFTAEKSGNYNIGFHAFSLAGKGFAIGVDDIEVFIKERGEEYDAGVIAITKPESGALGATEAVTITVKNFGTLTITELPVVLMLGMSTISRDTIRETILPDSTFEYTFKTTVNLSAVQTYTLIASTALADDVNPDNDRTTKSVTSTGPSSVEQRVNVTIVSIYPNPVSDVLYIQSAEFVKRAEIYDLQGKLVKTVTTNTQEIPVKNLNPGVYTIRFTTDKGVATQRFVKQ
jgi:sulfur carrier protein ThiS